MKYYHVSFDLQLTKLFEPRVPKVKTLPEDKSTPRICFSPTIEQCLQALSYDKHKYICEGNNFVLFTIDTDNLSESEWCSNEIIVQSKWVFDAVETGEIWLLRPKQLKGELCMLYGLEAVPTVLFSQVNAKDVLHIARSLSQGYERCYQSINCIGHSTKEVYETVIRIADHHKDYSVVDSLLEEIGMQNKFVQTCEFCNVRYHRITEKTNLF